LDFSKIDKNTEDIDKFTEEYLKYITENYNELKKNQELIISFVPKIFAMKRPFNDPATESRVISISMKETKRKDIPILLPSDFSIKIAAE
jgi:hypothetical protein